MKVISDIQKSNSDSNCLALITVDSSSAFDTVDHEVLLKKLKNQFFVQGNALRLLESYVKGRQFSVNINGKISSYRDLKFGVPQGSLLGPLLYIVYTGELHYLFNKHNLDYHMYADDIQLYLSFKEKDTVSAKNKINDCLTDIRTWMGNNYLKLNTDKTSLKIFNFHVSPDNFYLHYNQSIIKPIDSLKILGIMLNNNLDKNLFIANKTKICNYHLKNLWNINSSLNKSSKLVLVTNLILSTLDYCNILLFDSTKKQLRPLNLILNKSVRFIYKIPTRYHITPYLKDLHFLPLQQRIVYKVCLMGFKIFNNFAPSYLTQHFIKYKPSTGISLRQVGRDPYMFVTEMSDYKVKNILSGIRIEWNNLPVTMRKEESLTLFKIQLKTWLFKKAYD